MNANHLLEAELVRREITWAVEEDGRYRIEARSGETAFLVSLDNLQRDLNLDGDESRVGRFIDSVLAELPEVIDPDGLYWCLEGSCQDAVPDYAIPVSDEVNRVLVHLSTDRGLIVWVTPAMLEECGLSVEEASDWAFRNLALAAREAQLEFQEVDDVRLGYVTTGLPFKTALLLAPNLRELVDSTLGWPLQAVAPDRDFLFLWAARHAPFANRVGRETVRQFQTAPYPLSTEVYEISDAGIRALGAFPVS